MEHCPHCGGVIIAGALKCKHCKRLLSQLQPSPQAEAAQEPSKTSAPSGQFELLHPSLDSAPVRPTAKPEGVPLSAGDKDLLDLLVARGLLQRRSISSILAERTDGDSDLMGHLVRVGALTEFQAQNVSALRRQTEIDSSALTGRVAVQRMLISEEQLQTALGVQAADVQPRKLAQILLDLKFITESQKAELLRSKGEVSLSAISIGGAPGAASGYGRLLETFKDSASALEQRFGRKWLMLGVAACAAAVLGLVAFTLGGKAEVIESCTMNGNGKATCAFTNRGTSKGAICGNVVGLCKTRFLNDTALSPVICSGTVEPDETKNVEMSFVDFAQLVERSGAKMLSGSWSDYCSFAFVEAKK